MSILNRLSLRAKLFCAFSMMSFFVVLVGGASYLSGRMTVSEYRKIALKNLPASVAAANLRGLSKDVRSSLLRLGANGITDEELENGSNRLKDLLGQYEDAANEYKALPFVEGERELFEATQEKWTALASVVIRAMEERLKKTPQGIEEYGAILKGDFREKNSDFADAINSLVVFQHELATKSREQAEHAEVTGNRTSFLLILIGFFIAMSVGYLLGSRFSRSLLQLSNRLNAGAENVSTAAFEIASISESLASQSQEQAASVQETSAAVVEITSTVAKSADSAKQSEILAHTSQKGVEEGKVTIDGVIQGLNDLKSGNDRLFERVTETTTKMDQLVDIIREIEAKTKVINDIVFQTKLLSFNASVEAARAGEAGKGFAVVAEEVGNLAQMSGSASNEIAAMLLSSVDSVNQLVKDSKSALQMTMDETNRSLNVLRERVLESKEVFNHIDRNSLQVVEQMGLINQAAAEQNTGMDEIAKAVSNIEATMNTNTAISEKTANAATGLRSEVETLKFVIGDLLAIVHGHRSQSAAHAKMIEDSAKDKQSSHSEAASILNN